MNDNKTNRILDHLLGGKTITPRQAVNQFNCFRLASIIFNIKAKGYKIKSALICINGIRYSKYWIAI